MSQNEIEIIAQGQVGVGKSLLLQEIELVLQSCGVEYEWADPFDADAEKNMNPQDREHKLAALKALNSKVILHERVQPNKKMVLRIIEEGVAAQQAGKKITDNPYLISPIGINFEQAYYWLHGFAGAPDAMAQLSG